MSSGLREEPCNGGASVIQATQEDRRFLVEQDEERDRIWAKLLFNDSTRQENIDLFLCVAVEGAKQNNWLCMDKFIRLYTEHESKNLGMLARIMEDHAIELNGEKVNNTRERALLQELFEYVKAYMLSAQSQADQIYANEAYSTRDKEYYLNSVSRNYAMCKTICEWMIGMQTENEVQHD